MSLIPATFVDGEFVITDDGGNSATLRLSQGDQSISGIRPDGREVGVYQSRGATTGLRQTARAYPSLSVTGQLSSPSDAFNLLMLGKTAGYVSTSVDIGDSATVDGTWSFDYGSESREVEAEDLMLTSFDLSEGDPSTVSFTCDIIGPLDIDGTNIIPSR